MTHSQLLALARACAKVRPVNSCVKGRAALQLLKLTLAKGTR